jgi:DNA-binding GntR family transcriptional regulator
MSQALDGTVGAERMGRTTRSRRTPAEIADAIRDEILRGTLEPGSSARQDELAARYCVSRVPVREALRSLVAEGLVSWESQRGFRIARLAPDEAREILEIRSLLEVQALHWAFPRIDGETIWAAKAALELGENAEQIEDWSRGNAEFHAAILGRCERPHLLTLIQQLHNRTDRYVRLLIARADYRKRAELEHRAILGAIEVGNATAAASLLEQHIVDTGVWLDNYLAEQTLEAELGRADGRS